MNKTTKAIIIVVCFILACFVFYINIQNNKLKKAEFNLEEAKVELEKTESANMVLWEAVKNPSTEKKTKIIYRKVPYAPDELLKQLDNLKAEIQLLEGENQGLYAIYELIMANLPPEKREEIIIEIGEKSEPKVPKLPEIPESKPTIDKDKPVEVDFRRFTVIAGYPAYLALGYRITKKYDISLGVDTEKHALLMTRW